MNRPARKAIFVVFLLFFCVTAPLVVLYTAGYRYDFGTGRIVQTGVFSISSTPKGASIVLDGTPSGATTPALLKNVMPGNHRVRVEKSGYSFWEKNLAVESRATTFADDITLFLETEPGLLRETSLAATGFNPLNGRAAYAQTEGQWTEIWTFDPSGSEESLVSRVPAAANAGVELKWPYGSSVLAIQTGTGAAAATAYVDADTGTKLDAPAVTGFDLSVLDDRVAVSRRDGDSNVILAYVPLGTYTIHSSPDGIVTLEDAAHERVVLVRSEGGDQPILLNADATVWEWEPGGRRLLYSNGFDLHVYDAQTHSDATITRLSSEITGVAWYPDHATVLYAQEDAIYAAELDPRDVRNTVRLVTGSNLSSMHAQRSTLYFFGTINETSGLYARELDK